MITLNSQQQEAISRLMDFIKSDDDYFTLIGAAGTGKTTTIQHFIKQFTDRTRICMTAPSNKAVRVLKKMSEAAGLNRPCLTIHSLLGLKVTEQNGRTQIKAGGKNQLADYDIIIIDECSMLGIEIMQHIVRAMDDNKKVIYMGDQCQLPPVGEKESPSFAIKNHYRLTQVMRQRDENPILGLCTDLRHAIEEGAITAPTILPLLNATGTIGISVMRGDSFKQFMPHAFSNQQFDKNYDRFRIIAWRNQTVDYYNDHIQKLRYPNLKDAFAIGEPIVFSSPLHAISTRTDNEVSAGWDEIVCSTESEGLVEDIQNGENIAIHINGKDLYTASYRLTCRLFTSDNDQVITCTIPANKAEYKALTKAQAESARNPDHPTTWFDYYKITKLFADVRPAYAMTAHKSQGSTYENVFIDGQDILINPDKPEALRCLYVAVSRASNNVVINL